MNLKLQHYINTHFDIEEEYQEIFGKSIPTGKMFCPFHPNSNTPAAKRYGNGIKCFGQCNRFYTVYDLLKTFNPNKLKEIEQSVILDEVEEQPIKKFEIKKIDRTKSIKEILDFICE